MGCDTLVEGETILRVQEKDSSGNLYCIYEKPKHHWLQRIPFIGWFFGYEQFGVIKPKNPSEFEQEGGIPPRLGTKFKLIVKLEKL